MQLALELLQLQRAAAEAAAEAVQLALPLQQLKIEMPLHPLNQSSALRQHARVLERWLHNSASVLEIHHHDYPQLTKVVHLNLPIYLQKHNCLHVPLHLLTSTRHLN